jgi:hypothetical protein
MNLLARDNHSRARYMFPGEVYNAQESRRRSERKFRDWEGWLALVAEYHKEELHSTRPVSMYTDERYMTD